MSEQIAFKDIKVGDKVRIVDHQVIEVRDKSELYLNHIHGPKLTGWERSFELIERPLPPLPTEVGSVIEITDNNPFEDSYGKRKRWFLREPGRGNGRLWQGTGFGEKLLPDELMKLAERHGGFEVLL